MSLAHAISFEPYRYVCRYTLSWQSCQVAVLRHERGYTVIVRGSGIERQFPMLATQIWEDLLGKAEDVGLARWFVDAGTLWEVVMAEIPGEAAGKRFMVRKIEQVSGQAD